MDRKIITLPPRFLEVLNFNWRIDWRSQSAGEFNNGTTGVYYGGFPRWVGNPRVHLSGRAIGQWDAIRNAGQGRLGLFLIPLAHPVTFVLSDTGGTREEIKRGKLSEEGNYSAQGNGTEYEPFCLVSTAASIGAEEITVDMSPSPGYVPRQGQIMSTPNHWPFQISYVFDEGGGIYRLGIQMPLREAITAGDILRLRGLGLFQLEEDASGAAGYGAGATVTPTISFLEALSR